MIGRRLLSVFIIALFLWGAVGIAQAAEEGSFWDRWTRWRSQRTAEQFVRQSPTYAFDGIANSLGTTGAVKDACDTCWTITIDFRCAHDGYGDRTGQALDDVVTSHTATIAVEQYEVIKADLDGQWDMFDQKALPPPFEPSPEQLKSLVDGYTAFALDLYQQLVKENDDFFFSPYSVSTAMAMAFAGASNHTEEVFASGMYYDLPQDELHPTIGALGHMLDSRGRNTDTADDGTGFQLNTVQSAWGQEGPEYEQSYLDILELYYGSKLQLVNYKSETGREAARKAINEWVAQHTNDRIKDLLEKGTLTKETILVLVNAIYFLAQWELPFNVNATADQPFYKLDGTTVDVPMMHQTQDFNYMQTETWQAVELTYDGGELSMVIVLPEQGQFESVQSSMDTAFIASLTAGLAKRSLALSLPKFSLESKFSLMEALKAMGMGALFNFGSADFSGMVAGGGTDIYISDVIHQAIVDVDEYGTEAAAATAVIVNIACDGASSGMPVKVDRPFIFMIRDLPTNSILFMGRVLNP